MPPEAVTHWPADAVSRVPTASLVPYARNARTHSDAQIAQIAASIREWGWTIPVLVDEAGTLIAGHGRLLAAFQLGIESVPAMRAVGWSEGKRRAYALADNKLALNAGWDDAMLAQELADLGEIDLSLTGFSPEEFADLLASLDDEEREDLPEDTEPQTDRAGELREQWGVETGQLWQLGEHRILCGDATSADHVDMVMSGERADLCLTDPPYGIGDTASDKNNYDQHDDSRANLVKIIDGFFHLARDISTNIVLTPGNGNVSLYPQPTWTMAWFTPAGVGRGPWGFCCWQPILCFGKDPKLARGKGCHPDAIVHTESAEKLGHPCSKPIGFWEWVMKRASEDGDTVYEPFSGSGTTIIACENLGRKCRAIEISPAYVAVALQRWADHTGKTPALMP